MRHLKHMHITAALFALLAVGALVNSDWRGALNAALWCVWCVLWVQRERQQEDARALSFRIGWRVGARALAEHFGEPKGGE